MRRAALLLGLGVAVAVVLIGVAAVAALGIRRELDAGRARLLEARSAFTRGDFQVALERFEDARTSFADASAATEGLPYRAASAIPIVGRTFAGIDALSSGGDLTARAGAVIASAFAASGGIEGLVAADGTIALGSVPALAEALAEATPLLRRASAIVDGVATSLVPGPLRDARRTADEQLDDAVRLADVGGDVLERLPGFLGADAPAVYLVGAENPAELRGSGGLIGAYALLTIDDGRMDLSPFREIQSLPQPDLDAIEPPNADYARLYDAERTGARGAFWLNVNLTPDFPSAALAFERSFEVATGTDVDGVITADPFALAALVDATGPTDVPTIGLTLAAEDVVPLLSSEGFALIDDAAKRKHVLGEAAGSIVERALADADADVLRALVETASEGHLKVYSDDAAMQAAFERTGAGGALAVDDGTDLLAVIVNNAAGNKLDYYMHREVTYDVWLQPDGAARARVAINLSNQTPDEPLPARVLGQGPRIGLRPGETLSLVNVYCARCELLSAHRNGESADVAGSTELGATFFQLRVPLVRGAGEDLVLAYTSRDVWQGDGSAGRYTLTLGGQTTIVPTRTTVRIHLPEGVEVSTSPEGADVEGSTVTWSGSATGRTEIGVEFETPSLLGVWRELTSAFD